MERNARQYPEKVYSVRFFFPCIGSNNTLSKSNAATRAKAQAGLAHSKVLNSRFMICFNAVLRISPRFALNATLRRRCFGVRKSYFRFHFRRRIGRQCVVVASGHTCLGKRKRQHGLRTPRLFCLGIMLFCGVRKLCGGSACSP